MASHRQSRSGTGNPRNGPECHFCVEGSQVGSVWDMETQNLKKVIKVEGTAYVLTVDISPDSTRFATSTGYDEKASIWNIFTGERLVGPLQHNGSVASIKFSPNGGYIAALWGLAKNSSIHVFDSHNGHHLVKIDNEVSKGLSTVTPLAWSSNGQQIFAVSSNHKIKSFDVFTGSQLAESRVHADNDVDCIALASNGKFLATFVDCSIMSRDTSILRRIVPVIMNNHIHGIWSIALSLDCSYLATRGFDGNITIRNFSNILPDLYGPFLVSGCAFTMLAYQISHASSFPHWYLLSHLLKKNPDRKDPKIGHKKKKKSLQSQESTTTEHQTRLQ